MGGLRHYLCASNNCLVWGFQVCSKCRTMPKVAQGMLCNLLLPKSHPVSSCAKSPTPATRAMSSAISSRTARKTARGLAQIRRTLPFFAVTLNYPAVLPGQARTQRVAQHPLCDMRVQVNYVDRGDPIGNWGNHFGAVQLEGPHHDKGVLTAAEILAWIVTGTPLDGLAVGASLYHPLPHYAADLHLPLTWITVAGIPEQFVISHSLFA